MNSEDYIKNLTSAIYSIDINQIEKVCDIIEEVRKDGGLILTAGNGGSSCIAQHLAEELTEVSSRDLDKNSLFYRSICLSDNSGLLTCIANDEGYRNIFIQQCWRYIDPVRKNCFIGFTTSGKSQNIIQVLIETDTKPIIIFTGKNGVGISKPNLIEIKVYSDITPIIEDCFQICVHLIWNILKGRNTKNDLKS